MRIENRKLLMRFRGPGPCELCGRNCFKEAAHVFSCGAGRVDHPVNVLGIGGFPCHCHTMSHNGNGPKREDMLRVTSAREGWSIEAIVDVIHATRRAKKEAWHLSEPDEGESDVLCGTEKPYNSASATLVVPLKLTPCPLCWALWLRSESAKPLAF